MKDAPTTKKSELARRLRIAREWAGLSQSQVALKLQLHRPTISELEAGRRKVSAEELLHFSKLYGVSLSWLSGEEESSSHSNDVQVAARELSKLKSEDLKRLLDLLAAVKEAGGAVDESKT
jgi:transcriptional regulator with XRE-family HTH domain